MKNKKILGFAILTALLTAGFLIFAFGASALTDPLQGKTFLELLDSIASALITVAIPVAVIMIVYAGVRFLTSGGNQTAIASAKKTLLWTIVGLAIVLIGKGFMTLIQSVLELGK